MTSAATVPAARAAGIGIMNSEAYGTASFAERATKLIVLLAICAAILFTSSWILRAAGPPAS